MTFIVDPPAENINGVNKHEISLSIAKMLENGRDYFGSSGASLTHHANNPDYDSAFKKKIVTTGMEGERSTTKALKEWIKDKETAILLDSVHIKGFGKEEIDEETGTVEGGDTDHILIIGSNVILIDTKRWKSKRAYSVSPKGQILRSGKYFSGGKVRAKQAKYMWKKYLHNSAKVSSIVCINSEKVFAKVDQNSKKAGFQLVTIENLFKTLDWRYERMSEYDKTHINSTLVSQIAMCCIKPFDAYKRVFDMDKIDKFK